MLGDLAHGRDVQAGDFQRALDNYSHDNDLRISQAKVQTGERGYQYGLQKYQAEQQVRTGIQNMLNNILRDIAATPAGAGAVPAAAPPAPVTPPAPPAAGGSGLDPANPPNGFTYDPRTGTWMFTGYR